MKRSRFLYLICAIFISCRNELRSEIGSQAYRMTGEIVDFGPRPPGSPAIQKVRDWIEQKATNMGFALIKRPFVAKTPTGFVNMVNLSYNIPGMQHQGQVILVAHYDSKTFSDKKFVGANDAASSVALLLALSPKIQKLNLPFDVQVAFVDGEEAFVEWNFHDSLYGSRQMVQDIRDRSSIKALIVADMIGDKNLTYVRSRGVDEKLFSYFEQALAEMKESDKLETQWTYVMDDHTPFVEAGIPSLHLMDFTYGSHSSPGIFWHTENDTMENISAESLSITGEAILRVLKKIQ